jgi:quercetin dioxygenase-like cupin family protein
MNRLLAIGVGLMLAASVAFAQTMTSSPGDAVKRTQLEKSDYPEGHVTHMQLVEIAPNTPIARHIHPGVETSYVLEGELELVIDDKRPKLLKADDSFSVPANTVHGGKVGAKTTKLIVTYVVDRTKPIASVVPTK